MNRRDFLTGLGALLATSAMVKPVAAPSVWGFDPEIGRYVPMATNSDYFVICEPYMKTFCEELLTLPPVIGDIQFAGTIGEYLGIRFIDPAEIYDPDPPPFRALEGTKLAQTTLRKPGRS